MSPWLRVTRVRTRSPDPIVLEEEGVGWTQHADGSVTVTLDGRRETIASSELDSHEMYRRVIQRLADKAAPGARHFDLEQYEVWSWRRIRLRLLPLVGLAAVVLFVEWRSRRHGVDASRGRQ